MQFSLAAYSPAGTERIETKHQRLFEAWVQAAGEGSWKLSKVPVTPSKFRGGIGASRSISFSDTRARGYVDYVLRVPGLELHSDSLHIEFTPTPNNYLSLIDNIVPVVIQTVPLKKLTRGDSGFSTPEIGSDGLISVDGPTACGVSIYPVFFMSEETAVYKFGFGPSEMAERHEGIAEEVRLVAGGIYVIGSRQLMPFDQAVALAKDMEAALTARRAASRKFTNLFGLLSKNRR